MKIAIVGATGLVGNIMLKVLEEQGFANEEILVAASSKSVGKSIPFANRQLQVISIDDCIAAKPQIAIFSAGSAVSLQYAPLFAQNGTTVIDNSSAWRKEKHIPLVVPEINGDILTAKDKIIANPNCSTIQMVAALCPLHQTYGIKRIVVSTYQSVTGTGVKAVQQLKDECKGLQAEAVYPHPIHNNLFPHGGNFLDNGYTTEEEKLVDETRKILGDDSLQITATVVRVPVMGGHSEAVNIEFHKEYDLKDIKPLLEKTKGIVVQDDITNNHYPTPLHSEGKDEVFVGRIRRDFSQPKTLNIWVVSDNLRKGAATNSIQIAQYLIENKLI